MVMMANKIRRVRLKVVHLCSFPVTSDPVDLELCVVVMHVDTVKHKMPLACLKGHWCVSRLRRPVGVWLLCCCVSMPNPVLVGSLACLGISAAGYYDTIWYSRRWIRLYGPYFGRHKDFFLFFFPDAHNADCESTPTHNTNEVIYDCDLSGLMSGISFDYNTI